MTQPSEIHATMVPAKDQTRPRHQRYGARAGYLPLVCLRSQVLQRITEAYEDGDFIAHQIYQVPATPWRPQQHRNQVLAPNPDEPQKLISIAFNRIPASIR